MDDVLKLILFLFIFICQYYMLRNKGVMSHHPDFAVSHLFGYNDVFYIGSKGVLSNKELGSWIIDRSYDSLTLTKDTYSNVNSGSYTNMGCLLSQLLIVVRKYLKSDPLPRRYSADYHSDPNYLKNVLAKSNYSLSGFATLETNRTLLYMLIIL